MLFKLLADYRPKGVAVAWDTRPTHRAATAEAADVVYKEGRRAMPDLLREQFPYFRPIVDAFGYTNLEFEGWEADDVIATLATRADEAGIKTTIVSTDRDAFQLVTDNVTLMMTPRGVSDVNVYTPERVEARYGITPAQIPDFIGLKGDTSDNIPGVPGHRRQDGRAADRPVRLARGGARPRRRAHARALEGDPRARRPGAHRQGARDHAARPGARDGSRRARALAARPFRARRDLPALRVPQPAEPHRRAGRSRARRGAERQDEPDALARGADAARRRRPRGRRDGRAAGRRSPPARKSSSRRRRRQCTPSRAVATMRRPSGSPRPTTRCSPRT